MSDNTLQLPNDDGTAVEEAPPKLKRPPLFRVVLLNDDYTPMEFVVHVLERFFGMTNGQAVEIMLTVHRRGVAVVGLERRDVFAQGATADGQPPPRVRTGPDQGAAVQRLQPLTQGRWCGHQDRLDLVDRLGAAAGGMITKRLYLQAGLADANSDPTDPFEGFESMVDDSDFFKWVEVGFTPGQDRIYFDNLHFS